MRKFPASSLGSRASRRLFGYRRGALVAALASSMLGDVIGVRAQAPTPPGDVLVRARCSACHGAGLADLLVGCRERRGEEGLDRFLARHHARDPEERRQIVAWLEACAAGELPGQR